MIPLVALGLAVAAPVPKESDALKAAKWGEVKKGDPDDEVRFDGSKLVMRTTSGRLDFTSRGSYQNVTRVVRRVTGDFELSVTVAELSDPADLGRRHVTIKAGLCVELEGKSFALHRLHLHSPMNGSYIQKCLWIERSRAGGSLVMVGDKLEGDVSHLRWVRKNNVLTAMASADGKEWKEVFKKEGDGISADAEVGVFIAQDMNQETTAKFEKFQFTGTEVKADKK